MKMYFKTSIYLFLGNIGDMLDSIQFLNGPSTVTKDMKFTFLQQCALYVEPENFTKTVHGWVTPRYSPVKYLYQAPNGIPPPLGMRSAVPLGGMGTGKYIRATTIRYDAFLLIVLNNYSLSTIRRKSLKSGT